MDKAEPIPAVSVAMLRENAVLLVKRGRAPSKGFFAFPGGRVEAGESLEAAARRELLEETGLLAGTMVPVRTILIDSRAEGAQIYRLTVFSGAYLDGEPVGGDDAAEAAFHAIEDLANLPLTDSTAEIVDALIKRAVTP